MLALIRIHFKRGEARAEMLAGPARHVIASSFIILDGGLFVGALRNGARARTCLSH